MKTKLEKALSRGYDLSDLVAHVQKEIKNRIDLAKGGAAKEMAKYPAVADDLRTALEKFENTIRFADCLDDEMLAHDVITGQLNPMMNVFQHIMVRQAEIVALKRLAERMKDVQTEESFIEAFMTPEPAGSFFERHVMQCAGKTYPKVFNGITSLPQKK